MADRGSICDPEAESRGDRFVMANDCLSSLPGHKPGRSRRRVDGEDLEPFTIAKG